MGQQGRMVRWLAEEGTSVAPGQDARDAGAMMSSSSVAAR